VPALDAGQIAAGIKNPGQKRETEAPSDFDRNGKGPEIMSFW
jgi:hypothetical protein